MAKQIVNVGEEANDGQGDPIRTAWQKAMANFDELYDNWSNLSLTDAGIVDGVAGQVLTTDGDGNFTFEDAATGTAYANADVDAHLNTSNAANNQVLSWNGTDYAWVNSASGGIALTDLSANTTAAGTTSLTYDSDTGEFLYVPPVIPTDITDLGITDGSSGQVLTTDGAGNFTFTTVSSGGSSLQARTVLTFTTTTLNAFSGNYFNITGFKSYALLSIETDDAAWVRIYTDEAARAADLGRTRNTDPAPDAGVIAEVITTGAEVVRVSPGAIGYNLESTPTTAIPCNILNDTASPRAVTVKLTVLQLEA